MTRAAIETAAARAVVRAARDLVRHRRWWAEIPPDRPLPDALAAALERALAALDDAEADCGRG